MYTFIGCVVTGFDDEEATITIQTVDGSEEGVVETSAVRLEGQQLGMPLKGLIMLELVKEMAGPEDEPKDFLEVISPWGTTLQVLRPEGRGILSLEKEIEETGEYSQRGLIIRIVALLIVLAGITLPRAVLHQEGVAVWLTFLASLLVGIIIFRLAP